ncbi:MAG: energy transducer TonB [Pyrinomonadaceae bacterium]
MRSASFITITKELLTQRRKDAKTLRFEKTFSSGKRFFAFFAPLHLCVFALIFFLPVTAQKVALLSPDGTEQSKAFAARLVENLEDKVNLLDGDLSVAAYLSVSPSTPFNLTATDSKLIGSAIGCEFFVLVRSATQRRSAFRRDEYYETYAHIYVVSSRTGRLVFWKNQKREAAKPDAAAKLLDDSVDDLAKELVLKINSAQRDERNSPPILSIEEVPDADSPNTKDFKAPIPYRRIKPEYTTEAALYGVTATIEILVDMDSNGSITRTEIVRWAGFGLDESVEKTVRAMNWRPAMRDRKPLAMRFLLRYNFKKIEKEDQ